MVAAASGISDREETDGVRRFTLPLGGVSIRSLRAHPLDGDAVAPESLNAPADPADPPASSGVKNDCM